MKITLLFLVAILSCAAAQSFDCDASVVEYSFECIDSGSECTSTDDVCEADKDCTYCEYNGLTYDNVVCTNGKCPTKYVGLDCSSSSQCNGRMDGTYSTCVDDVCEENTDGGYAWAGDSCSDDECSGSMTCDSGVCTEDSNGTCSDSSQCGGTRYCPLIGDCTDADASGDSCTGLFGNGPFSDSCDWSANLGCYDGNCISYESRAKGADCTATWQCADELICVTDTDGGTCEEYSEGGDSCSSDDDCEKGAFCLPCGFGCSSNGVEKDEYCIEEIKSINNCASDNNCKWASTGFSTWINGGCLKENCDEEIEEFLSCDTSFVDTACAYGVDFSSAASLSSFLF